MTVRVGAPDLRMDGRLVWRFGEDAVTASLELVQGVDIPAGTPLAARGVALPAWWWRATGLVASDAAKWHVVALDGEHGEAVVLTDEDLATVTTTLVRALANAHRLDQEAFKALQRARDPAPRASDFPLGAHVTDSRHEEVLLLRLAMPEGRVRTWTRVAPGAGPAEFERLQEAQGAYHVALVEHDDGRRTVGLWTGRDPPVEGTLVRPIVQRLHLRDGVWRYGVALAPTL